MQQLCFGKAGTITTANIAILTEHAYKGKFVF